jgi:RND family efflux transporter MFP subunit
MVLVASTLVLVGCNGKKTAEAVWNEAVTVKIQSISATTSDKKLFVSGNIEGNKTVRLGFMVAGRINFIAAEEGQKVQDGQVLASLDPESYIIAKDMADANLDQTQDEYNRLSKMYATKSISESDYSKINTALKVAKSQQQLQAKNLKETKLYAPISGILLKKFTEKGEIIGVGLPLFVVSDIRTVKVNASIPESELRNLHIGNTAIVNVSSLDKDFSGKITEIGSLAEATTRTFAVKIELKNPDFQIRPGMTAEIQIKTKRSENYIAIPADVVLHDVDNSSYVYVADIAKKIAIKRIVSLGSIIDNDVKVISGLNAGEQLIVVGQSKLSNGTAIVIK